MGSCAITAFPYDTFGDGWEGAFGKLSLLDSNFQEYGTAFQFVSSNSTVTEFTTDLFWYTSVSNFDFGAEDTHLRLEIVKGAVSTGTGPVVAGTIIPCDSDYPHYNGETCIPYHRPWEMGFGVTTQYANVYSGSTDRNTYYGGVGSIMTIGCEPKTESVYYPVNANNYFSEDDTPFGGSFSFVHLEQDYSNNVKVSGGPPVDVKFDYDGDVCNNIELQLFDQQGFGWHIPGRVQYTYYSVDTEGEDGTHELLMQGTLVGCKSKAEKIKLPKSASAFEYNLRLAGRNDPNEWAHHAVFTTEDSSSESVTIKPGNQIVFSVTNCEVTITSVDTYATATEYGPYVENAGDFMPASGSTILNQDTFGRHPTFNSGSSVLASSRPSSNNASFEVTSSAMMFAAVGIFVGGLVGMFVEKRRKAGTVSYSSVDESSTHSDLSALKKKVSSAHATSGLV